MTSATNIFNSIKDNVSYDLNQRTALGAPVKFLFDKNLKARLTVIAECIMIDRRFELLGRLSTRKRHFENYYTTLFQDVKDNKYYRTQDNRIIPISTKQALFLIKHWSLDVVAS